MLKRARASTPPPASSTPDLLPMLADEPSARHTMKRRRVLPPSLDGATRGMNYLTTQPQRQSDDDGEEYMDDDDDEQGRMQLPVPQTYKAVNSLLHDLHAEHQHRQLWSSPSPSTPFAPAPTYSHSSASAVGMAQHHIAQTARAHLQQLTPPFIAPMRSKQMVEVQLPTPPPSTAQDDDAAMQYEDTNRLLREAFLSRRRRLTSS